MGITLFMGLFISGMITSSINELVNTMNDIQMGDLTARAVVKSEDETQVSRGGNQRYF